MTPEDVKKALFDRLVGEYREALTDEIENASYWGAGFGVTKRRNGQTVIGGFRDIVDTGELRDSQRDYKSGEYTQTFEWTAPHAKIVHFGSRKVPPRPWTRRAALKMNIEDLIK